ncbi:glycosyltransferase family protein [Enterobacter roggenkampii]|uniref:hypothetical protein n=1 Tax=Enterobacter roggenkampii TaxID=1812935 RepID=UPI001F4676CD|nr:hypothetical protein [Enterobacter roggenkampii]
MKNRKISLVATYSAANREAVKSLLRNPAAPGLYEMILVNEGNAEDIIDPSATSIRITNFQPHSEPLAMAVGAHYASGDVVVLCRKPESVTEVLCKLLRKARRHYSPCAGLHVFMNTDFPWRYDIDPGFVKGESGRFLNLSWRVCCNVEA